MGALMSARSFSQYVAYDLNVKPIQMKTTGQRLFFSAVSLVLALCCNTAWAQFSPADAPTVVVLSPGPWRLEGVSDADLKGIDTDLRKRSQELFQSISADVGSRNDPRLNRIIEASKPFFEGLERDQLMSAQFAHYANYRLFEVFNTLTFLPLAEQLEPRAVANRFSAVAARHKAQFVVNFSEVRVSKEGGRVVGSARVQLFDVDAQALLLDSTLVGKDQNQGFDFACQEGSGTCWLMNILRTAHNPLLGMIINQNPAVRKAQQLSRARAIALIAGIGQQQQKTDSTRVRRLFTQLPYADLILPAYFAGFSSPDSTRAYAFFVRSNTQENIMPGSYLDKDPWSSSNTTIETQGDPTEGENLTKKPAYEGIVIAIIRHEGKLYHKVVRSVRFTVASLAMARMRTLTFIISLGYFAERAYTPDPEFWSKGEFSPHLSAEKQRDLTLKQLRADGDPSVSNPEYLAYLEKELNENKQYDYLVGLPSLVAKLRKSERDESFKKLEGYETSKVKEALLSFEKSTGLKTDLDRLGPKETVNMIPNCDQTGYLIGLKLVHSKGKEELCFLYHDLTQQKWYRWTYFKDKFIKPNNTGYAMLAPAMVDAISEMSPWNWSFPCLGGEFWEKYVLIKSGSGFRYLEPIDN
jgi:hypothetical protein